MNKKQMHDLLEDKLAHLRLVMICNNWDYNLKNDAPNEFFKVTHHLRPYWEKRRNSMKDLDDLLVDLIHIPKEDSRPPWHKFYFPLVVYDEKQKIGATLYNKLWQGEEWTMERIRSLWVYHKETKQFDASYGSVKLNDQFDQLWDDENPDSNPSTDKDDDSDEDFEEPTRKGKEQESGVSLTSAQQKRKKMGKPSRVVSNVRLNLSRASRTLT